MKAWESNRFLILIRVNGLLRNAKKLYKAKQIERADSFLKEAKRVLDMFSFYNVR